MSTDVLETPKASESRQKSQPNIYTFLNYREYLKEFFQTAKKANKYFNYSHFARLAGMGSHSYLRMVINGERNLSTKSIHKFARALDLSKKETAYFETLAHFNQAQSETDRDLFFERMIQLRPKSLLQEVNPDQYEYFTNRHYVTIREMIALKNFREDYEWIGAQLTPPIKAAEAQHAIEVLLKLGLVKRNDAGILEHTRVSLTTAPEIDSIEIYDYNRQLLSEAKEAILTRPRDAVEMVSLTIPVPINLLPEVKKIMMGCKDEVLDLINRDKSGYDEVYQINFQYFPLTKSRQTPQEDDSES